MVCRPPWRAQPQPVCVHGFPLVDRPWSRQTRFSSPGCDPGQGALKGQLWERGEGRRRPQRPETKAPCPQPCRLLGAPRVMSTLGSRDRLCAPQTGLVRVGVRSPAWEPDSLVQSLSPLLGHLDVLGSWCETRCAFISTLPICKMGPQELLPPTKSHVPRNGTCWHLRHTCQHHCPFTPMWGPPSRLLCSAGESTQGAGEHGPGGAHTSGPELSCWLPLGAQACCWDTQRDTQRTSRERSWMLALQFCARSSELRPKTLHTPPGHCRHFLSSPQTALLGCHLEPFLTVPCHSICPLGSQVGVPSTPSLPSVPSWLHGLPTPQPGKEVNNIHDLSPEIERKPPAWRGQES